MDNDNILKVKDLSYSFHTYGGVVQAVRDVSFNVRRGEILGIVGESGCGKSVTAQSILKLNPEPPGFFQHGSILYNGQEIIRKTEHEMRQIRGKQIGFIFQDPMTSLNPTMRIGKQVEEIFVGDRSMTSAKVKARALEVFQQLGITDPERRLHQYPHELSGGMKQRVMIAIAIIAKPDLVIADEPTTSLDVTIEAQILRLLKDMSRATNTSIILITHDLGVIAKLCDRVLVMYGGTWKRAKSSPPSRVRLPICFPRRRAVLLPPGASTPWKSATSRSRRKPIFPSSTIPAAGWSIHLPPRWI